jgi:phenylpyruvate tautomerase PptA (4-oxalocrotonate tautomerase family)
VGKIVEEIIEDFVVAENFDLAWSNFDPFYPLPVNCPFHIERKDIPLNKLTRALLRQHRQTPKYFFSGHRGCGKSTELNRLAANPDIRTKFFIVKYSVKDICDVHNLNYIDVLFSIGAQLYIQYTDSGKELSPDLISDLEGWKNNIIEKSTEKSSAIETSVDGGLKTFFVSVMAKIKSEDVTRTKIRETIEPNLSDLIDKINMIIADIEGKEKKSVLVLIDDLDKPSLTQAKSIFYDNQTAITQPACYIVYTIPISISFTQEYIAIRDNKYFIPNIKLHEKNDKSKKNEQGYELLRSFIHKRMKANLIEDDALDLAIKMGAGVFRETARIMQISIDNAIENGRNCIIMDDVEKAKQEIRSDFKRMLTTDDYKILEGVSNNNEIHGIDKIGHLLHNLSVLEYMNGDTWCDIHPTLEGI